MKTILAGLEWQCHSPSHFTLSTSEGDVDLWYSSIAWRIFLCGDMVEHPYATRDEAAAAIANGIKAWKKGQRA